MKFHKFVCTVACSGVCEEDLLKGFKQDASDFVCLP